MRKLRAAGSTTPARPAGTAYVPEWESPTHSQRRRSIERRVLPCKLYCTIGRRLCRRGDVDGTQAGTGEPRNPNKRDPENGRGTYIVRDLGQQPTTWVGTGCYATDANQQRSQQCETLGCNLVTKELARSMGRGRRPRGGPSRVDTYV